MGIFDRIKFRKNRFGKKRRAKKMCKGGQCTLDCYQDYTERNYHTNYLDMNDRRRVYRRR